jgi:hypothetical protein
MCRDVLLCSLRYPSPGHDEDERQTDEPARLGWVLVSDAEQRRRIP